MSFSSVVSQDNMSTLSQLAEVTAEGASRDKVAAHTHLNIKQERLQVVVNDPTRTKAALEKALGSFDHKLAQVKRVHQEIESNTSIQELQDTIRELEEYLHQKEATRLAAVVLLRQMSDLESEVNVEVAPEDSASGIGDNDFPGFSDPSVISTVEKIVLPESSPAGSTRGSAPPVSLRHSIKMEKVVLDTFNGDVKDYRAFEQNIEVHLLNDPRMSDVERMTRLKQLVKGEAQLFLKPYCIRNTTFSHVWDLFKERFGRPEIIRNSWLTFLDEVEAPVAAGPGRSGDMWKFHDSIVAALYELSLLGVSGTQVQCILCPKILNKLPWHVKERWAIHPDTKGKENDVEYLLEFLKKLVVSWDTAQMYQVNDKKKTTPQRQPQGSAIALSCPSGTSGVPYTEMQTSGSNQQGKRRNCPFCKATDHSAGRCIKLHKADINARIAMVAGGQ